MSTLPSVFYRLARQTAEEIVESFGETDEERVFGLTEYADEINGHILTKPALEALIPDWEGGPEVGADAVQRFWKLFRPLVLAELRLELEPLRKAIKKEWDRRDRAVKEGRQW